MAGYRDWSIWWIECFWS